MVDQPKSKPVKEKPEIKPIEPNEEIKEEEGIDFMEILNNPLAQSLLGGCKDLFKKEKADPDVCEISIKAPSEVVLKLFRVEE